jgi:2-polyprenyl-3-methyl-5-hydroxy-6-metoxy-1,4-benzoquinol methylase
MVFMMVDNRIILILDEISSEDEVLDLGCVHHSAENESKDYWLHKYLCEKARYVLGLDLLEKDVQKLRRLGYNVVTGNVENVNLNKKFDVIVMGELIEHVQNVDVILSNIKLHLKDDGKLIITTPNTFNIIHFITILLRGKLKINEEHVAWYDPNTLNSLLKRSGFKISRIKYSKAEKRHPGWLLSNLIFPFRKQLGALGYVIVAVTNVASILKD